ncbi:MAG: hypothetical protein HYS08_08385, partial [Chlamydiae bacterium]|nr:hypothetical protein [Chlamydiota bacterium]
KMVCEGNKYDPDEKSRVSLLVISGIRNNELHEFLSRRPMAVKTCHLYQKDWKKFTKNEKYICISGQLIDKEIKNGSNYSVHMTERATQRAESLRTRRR